jgi:hypothetical protein
VSLTLDGSFCSTVAKALKTGEKLLGPLSSTCAVGLDNGILYYVPQAPQS